MRTPIPPLSIFIVPVFVNLVPPPCPYTPTEWSWFTVIVPELVAAVPPDKYIPTEFSCFVGSLWSPFTFVLPTVIFPVFIIVFAPSEYIPTDDIPNTIFALFSITADCPAVCFK